MGSTNPDTDEGSGLDGVDAGGGLAAERESLRAVKAVVEIVDSITIRRRLDDVHWARSVPTRALSSTHTASSAGCGMVGIKMMQARVGHRLQSTTVMHTGVSGDWMNSMIRGVGSGFSRVPDHSAVELLALVERLLEPHGRGGEGPAGVDQERRAKPLSGNRTR
ncbi:hypothetical protein [Kibdelosporangium phytohabitans]|uniref:hypothetical protein n=1 Tax=Kibdelosporangium phytohabitans TaxID=860235 RepID=UPI0012FAEA89|nr:hypothetical protein [Kibdelosporangium phytohabitans]MBE1463796.1 hypothetical protein [Kibdelosporangium phytohabitans]